MKQYYVIDTPEKMKAVSDPLRIRLMMILLHEEATGIVSTWQPRESTITFAN